MSDSSNNTTSADGGSDGSGPMGPTPAQIAEFALQLRVEYTSSLLSSLAYGLYLVLAGMAIYLLRKNGQSYAARRITLIYTTIMFAVTTIWYITSARNSAFIFVDSQLPDGQMPSACSVGNLMTKVTAFSQFLLSDGAMLFRMYITWNRDLRIGVLPALIYVASAVFGVLSELFCVNPQLTALSGTFRQVFFILTVVLNGFVTLAIAYKISAVMRDMGRHGHGNAGVESRAGAIAAVLAESAALYTIVGIAFTFTFNTGSELAIPLGTLFQTLSFLSPALIILRVALGVSFDGQSTQVTISRPDIEKSPLSLSIPSYPHKPRESVVIDISSRTLAALDQVPETVHTADDTTEEKNGPWSARHRWSVKSPVKSPIKSPVEQLATFADRSGRT